MNKQKTLKIICASTIASSAFVTTSSAEASSSINAEKLVKEAKELGTMLKWAISIEGSADGKSRPWLAYNATKSAYEQAVKEVSKLSSAQKQKYLAELDVEVKVHIDRTMRYIDAITAGEKIKEKQRTLDDLISRNIINDDTERAYHELTREIRKQALLLDRVYGKSTRELIRSQYKYGAEEIRDRAMYAVTVKIELDRAMEAFSAKESSIAEKHLAEAKRYLNYVDNAIMKNDLSDRLNKMEAPTIPRVEKVSAVEPKRIKIEFNHQMLPGSGANGAENINNYTVSGRTIKNAKLLDDKKSVLIELSESLSTNVSYTVTVKKNIHTDKNLSLGSTDYVSSFLFSDYLKPAVTFVTADSNGNLEIKFSELISASSPIAVMIEGKSVSYSALYNDSDSIIIPKSELNRLGLKTGNYYSIILSGARDLVPYSPNTMDTYRGNFFYNALADTMPPEVRSIQAKDEKTFIIEFSETLTDFTSSHLVINKGTTAIRPTSIKDVSGGLKTKFEIELPATVYAANEAAVFLNVQINAVKDLSNNSSKVSQHTVNLVRELNPPEFVNIEYVVATDEIHITFSKPLKSGTPTVNNMTFYDPDNNPIKPTVKQNVGNKMIIDAKNLSDGVYIINADAGLVKDNTTSQNDSLPFRVSVMKKADNVKPEVTVIQGATNGQIKAVFSEPVTKESAELFANYLIDGTALPANTPISLNSDQKVVTIDLLEGTITTTGRYSVTVRGVNDLSGNEINQSLNTITIKDNTQPILHAATKDQNNHILLTFSENIIVPTNRQINIQIMIDGNVLNPNQYTVGNQVRDHELLIIPQRGASFASGEIWVETTTNSMISDGAGNKVKAGNILVN